MNDDFYARLGVSPDASESAIRTAFRSLVADAMDDQPRFAALTEAFETLKDPEKRVAYDVSRASVSSAPIGAMAMGNATAMGGATLSGATVAMPAAANVSAVSGALVPGGACRNCGTVAPPDDGFCPECGLLLTSAVGAALSTKPQPKLIEESTGREFILYAGENVVGREGADIVLPDKTVSRRHARLMVETNGLVSLEELGSTNGTKNAGSPVAAGGAVRLSDGAQVTFGQVKTRLSLPAGVAPEPKAIAPMAPNLSRPPVGAIAGPDSSVAKLVFGDGRERTLMSVAVSVGRKATNDLVLENDAFVSGAHARLVCEHGAWRVIDIGSTNGTRVNGRRLAPQTPEGLSDGDTVQFGQTSVTFRGPK